MLLRAHTTPATHSLASLPSPPQPAEDAGSFTPIAADGSFLYT